MAARKDEEKKYDREALLLEKKKITYNLVLLLAASFTVLVGAVTMAWFVSNSKVNGEKMSVMMQGGNFKISCRTDGTDGAYFDDYHSKVRDSSAIIWQMTQDYNMENYEEIDPQNENVGIHPGSYGWITFYVTPLINSIDLDFEFEIVGYTATKDKNTQLITMAPLDPEESPASFLNGHILLFGNRTLVGDEYVYSDPILSNEDMKRTLKGINYTGQAVNIYWVWPKTLSKLVDATSCEKLVITEEPFTNTSGNDYAKIVENIVTYPQYYLKGFEADDEGEGENALTASEIATNYDI